MKILFGICGSFCCHEAALATLEGLISSGHSVTPVISENSATLGTRFGVAGSIVEKAEKLCGKSAVLTIPTAEKTVTGSGFDIMAIVPCTGNTLSKLASGTTDGPVTMAAKAMLRNKKPIVIAFASNDGLSGSLKNIAALLERKNFYFVPLKQDDFVNKPSSLACDFNLTEHTLTAALSGKQIQPVFRAPLSKGE